MNDLPQKPTQEFHGSMYQPPALTGSMYQVPAVFEHMQRLAKMFAESALVPQHMRENISNIVIALDIAMNMGESPIMVMQNMFFVHGRAGWLAQYMISRFNRSGIARGPIQWKKAGAGDALEMTAFATLRDGSVIEASVGMAMAKAEGWTKNNKYQTMGEHMLKYRSATFLIRLYAPQVMMGFHTVDELEDLAASGQLRAGADGVYRPWADEPPVDATPETAPPSSSLMTKGAEAPAREERAKTSPATSSAPAAAEKALGGPQGAATASEGTRPAPAPKAAPTARAKPAAKAPEPEAPPADVPPADENGDPLRIPAALDRRPKPEQANPAPAPQPAPEAPADDEPRKMPYQGPPGHWADEFIKLIGRMGTPDDVDELDRLNQKLIAFVHLQDKPAAERISAAFIAHRASLEARAP